MVKFLSMAANPASFLKEVRTEIAKVIWPTRQEALKLTLVVIFISVVVGVFIGGVDFLLTKITELVLKR